MNLNVIGALENKQLSESYFLSHPNEPLDKYDEYLLQGPIPASNSKNPRNLFADSNKEDGKWLMRTRNFLNRVK